MDVPDLVRERLGDEEIRAAVSLGDEDAVCLTASRTLVYRGEGLLSDESITVLPHDVERLDVKDGRRKTAFTLSYVDGTESFSVPNSRSDRVLELLMEGVLRVADVTAGEESVHGVYRFSELTLVLTDARLVKHVGSSVWDEDYEEFPFADLTGLAFEDGSVATQIVVSIDGRPQRIKAPNDEAPKLRQTLERVLFAYHDVDSLAALNEAVAVDEPDDAADRSGAGPSTDLTLDEGIDPLVGGPTDEAPDPVDEPAGASAGGVGTAGGESEGSAASAGASAADADPGRSTAPVDHDAPASGDAVPDVDPDALSRDDLDEIGDQLEALTTAVERQNKLLRKQHQTVRQLIQELRQGR